jgi:hypothetical protein
MRVHLYLNPSELPAVPPALLSSVWDHRNIVMRGKRRGDMQNPMHGSEACQLLEATWAAVRPLVRRHYPRHKLRSQALAYVEPGAPAQEFHCDLDGNTDMHTVIVPLTSEHDAGGTQFADGLAFTPVRGLVYAFDGADVHRGAAHRGQARRVFAAYVISTRALQDDNVFY